MADRQIFQLTPNATPTTSYVLSVQEPAGASEAVKTTLAQLKAALGLDLVSNTADANKPVSTATQTALDLKENKVVHTKVGHGFNIGWAVYKDDAGVWQRSNSSSTGAQSVVYGVVVSVPTADTFVLGNKGYVFDTTGLSLVDNTDYFLDSTTSGVNYTATEPTTTGYVSKLLFRTNDANQAVVLNEAGYELTADTYLPFESSPNFASINISTTKRLVEVVADEGNSGNKTLYFHTGTKLFRIATTQFDLPGAPVTPDAPTSGVVDDTANTFNWTNNPSFTALGDYEYTLNGGSSYSDVSAKPVAVGNVDKAIGQVGVRVKAVGVNPASSTLFNATAFTSSGGGETYTVERMYKMKFSNQYVGETGQSGWQGLQASGDGTVAAGYTKTVIRDSTNISTGSIGFAAVTGFTGSTGSCPKQATANTSIWCVDEIIVQAWTTTAATNTFKLTNLNPAKFYQIGFVSNSPNYLGISLKFGVGANETAAFASGNNYGACGPGDDLDDAAIKWIYNVQGDGSNEATITMTRTAGSDMMLNNMIVLETNIAKP